MRSWHRSIQAATHAKQQKWFLSYPECRTPSTTCTTEPLLKLVAFNNLTVCVCVCVCVCVSKPKGGHFVAVEVIVLVMLCVSVGDSVPPCIVLCLIHHLYYVMPSLLKQHLKRLQNIVAGIFLGGIMWWRGISWVEMHDNQRKELLSDPECRHHVPHATRNPPGNWPRKNTNQQEQRWWHAIANPHTSTRKQSWKMPKSSTINDPISNFELNFFFPQFWHL